MARDKKEEETEAMDGSSGSGNEQAAREDDEGSQANSETGTVHSVPLEDEAASKHTGDENRNAQGSPVIEDPPPKAHNSRQGTSKQGRDMRCFYVAATAFCLAILVAILILILHFTIGNKQDKEQPKEQSPPSSTQVVPLDGLDPEWVQSVQQRQTTPFEDYDHFNPDCSLGNYVQPHVILQCDCQQQITVVADDIRQLYQELVDVLLPIVYPDDTPTLDITSCDPRNQALLWLASGDTRASSDLLVQRYVMALLYNEWFGPDWDQNNLWWSDGNECLWLYVICSNSPELRVVSLGLDEIHLYGTLPTELTLLSSLRGLSVTRNHLSSTIPPALLRGLTNLELLSLYDNELTGSVPDEISYLTNLKQLRLAKNELSGSLTTVIGEATSLMELSLGFNTIQQAIPSEIGHLTQLTSLSLEENRFSRILPTEIGQLTDLRELYVYESLMNGPIPTQIGSLTDLETLQLFGSGFSGTIPTEIGNLVALNRMDINDNKIVGPFPSELGQVTELYYLTANENQLTGSIPTEFGLLTNMTRMEIFGNDLSGTVPSELGSMQELDIFQLYSNPKLIGTMPPEVCALHDTGELTLLMVQCPGDGSGILCSPEDCCRCRPGR